MDQKAQNEFLLYCLGIGNDDKEIDLTRLEQLPDDDWSEVIQLANRHNVTPLLYHHFSNTGIIEHIPGEVKAKLYRIYLYSGKRNMQLYHELSKVMKVLKQNNIPVILLKGAALAEPIYKNIALRPMFDVDVLVKRKDIYDIDGLLEQLGHKSDMETLLLSKRHIDWVRHIAYISETIQIEAHFGIFEFPNINPWENASSVTINSLDASILGPNDFLLHLCIHLYDHLYLRKEPVKLIWWFDIAKIINHYNEAINWDYVIQTIAANRAKANIYGILRIINDCFKGDIPEDVLNKINSRQDSISMIDLMNQEQAQGQEEDPLLSYVPFTAEIPTMGDKIYHIFRLIFPCKNYMIHHYSIKQPNHIYFHYVFRLYRGGVKVLSFLWHLPSRQKRR